MKSRPIWVISKLDGHVFNWNKTEASRQWKYDWRQGQVCIASLYTTCKVMGSDSVTEFVGNCLLRTRDCRDVILLQGGVATFDLKRKEGRKTKRW